MQKMPVSGITLRQTEGGERNASNFGIVIYDIRIQVASDSPDLTLSAIGVRYSGVHALGTESWFP